MKNFSNTKVVLVTTIPAQTQAGMIDYTFLLPGKNDLCKLRSAGTERWRESVSLFFFHEPLLLFFSKIE
jgi:hypothetical protein